MSAAVLEPYENFRFAVEWDAKRVPGVIKVSGLIRTTDVLEHREGTDRTPSHKEPGLTQFAAITLERGLTADTRFEEWANEVFTLATGTGQPSFRKDVAVTLLDEREHPIVTFAVLRCWPSEYVAIDGLDANGDAIIIEKLRLENEGWRREGD